MSVSTSTPPASSITPSTVWPHLDNVDIIAIVAFNVGSFLISWILLRLVWPPPSSEEVQRLKVIETEIQNVQNKHSYQSLPVEEQKECLEGESAGNYDAPWTETFDLTFVIIMSSIFALLCVWTTISNPGLWSNGAFWLEQLPKILVMMAVSLLGGLLCRYFCELDTKQYVITNRTSAFKVNYTRKLQHFAAYMVPLVLHTHAVVPSPLTLAWGNWVTLLAFLILIKPLRERFTFIMLQFNSLDRPEDRPHTLGWIVGGNIIPGCILVVFYRWLYSYTGQQDMAYIFVFITGIGDGLAEPVGMYIGRHKYWTSALGGGRKYQRSLEGSACVWLSSILFVSVMWYTFENRWQFWMAILAMPPIMTIAEAKSPHTLDTPFLMGLGGLTLFVISHLTLVWS